MKPTNKAIYEGTINEALCEQIDILRGRKDTLAEQIKRFPFGSAKQIETRKQYNSVLKEIGGLKRILNERSTVSSMQAGNVPSISSFVPAQKRPDENKSLLAKTLPQKTVAQVKKADFDGAYQKTLTGDSYKFVKRSRFQRLWDFFSKPKEIITGNYQRKRETFAQFKVVV